MIRACGGQKRSSLGQKQSAGRSLAALPASPRGRRKDSRRRAPTARPSRSSWTPRRLPQQPQDQNQAQLAGPVQLAASEDAEATVGVVERRAQHRSSEAEVLAAQEEPQACSRHRKWTWEGRGEQALRAEAVRRAQAVGCPSLLREEVGAEEAEVRRVQRPAVPHGAPWSSGGSRLWMVSTRCLPRRGGVAMLCAP